MPPKKTFENLTPDAKKKFLVKVQAKKALEALKKKQADGENLTPEEEASLLYDDEQCEREKQKQTRGSPMKHPRTSLTQEDLTAHQNNQAIQGNNLKIGVHYVVSKPFPENPSVVIFNVLDENIFNAFRERSQAGSEVDDLETPSKAPKKEDFKK